MYLSSSTGLLDLLEYNISIQRWVTAAIFIIKNRLWLYSMKSGFDWASFEVIFHSVLRLNRLAWQFSLVIFAYNYFIVDGEEIFWIIDTITTDCDYLLTYSGRSAIFDGRSA